MVALPRVKRVAEPATGGRRPTVLLAIGAAAGLSLAAIQILAPAPPAAVRPTAARTSAPAAAASDPASGAIAVVNGRALSRDDYDRAVTALASDRREPITEADRRRVLDRMIDEELLLQHGVDLELARRDPQVRTALVTAVIDGVVSESAAHEPTADEVARFYAENQSDFAQPGRVRVRQVVVHVTGDQTDDRARARADQAAQRMRSGEPLEKVAAEVGDAEVAPIPDTLLPPAKLREYLGPTASRTAFELAKGAVSDPVRSADGYHVLEVVERDSTTVPPLAEIEPQVRDELRRRSSDTALRKYLDDLRARANIVLAPGTP